MPTLQGLDTSYSKPFNPAYHGWRDVIEKATDPLTLIATQQIFKGSALISRILGNNGLAKMSGTDIQTGDKKEVFKITKTFTGRYKRIALNKFELITDPDELNDFAIEYGDDINPKSGRDILFGHLDAFDIGGAMTITEDALQEIDGKNNKLVEWIADSTQQIANSVQLYLFKQILSGTPADANGMSGIVTRFTDGAVRKGAVGLDTIISSNGYMGLDYTKWKYWRGHNYDLTDATKKYFGLYGAGGASPYTLSTIEQWQTVRTNTQIMAGYDFVNMCRRALPKNQGSKYIVLCHPYFYDYIWLPMIESQKVTAYNKVKNSKDVLEFNDENAMKMGEFEIVKEEAQINNKYLMPIDKIYIIDLNDLFLEAHKDANLIWHPWEYIQQQHGSMFKKFDSTLIFGSKRRYGHAIITLPATLVTALKEIVGSPVEAE